MMQTLDENTCQLQQPRSCMTTFSLDILKLNIQHCLERHSTVSPLEIIHHVHDLILADRQISDKKITDALEITKQR